MNKRFMLLLSALLVSVMFASMLGGSASGAAVPASAGVRWEAAVKLQPEAAKLALQDRSILTETMRMTGVNAAFTGGVLSMKGQEDMAQVSTTLFDTGSTWMDFLGGVVEMTIFLPSDGRTVTVNLEARNTTGYQWELLAGDGIYVLDGEPTFTMRYQGKGVPSIQTFHLRANRSGDASIRLRYRRAWEPVVESHAQVKIWVTRATSLIELSDPTPAVIPVQEVASSNQTNPYAMLDEIKTVLPAYFDWRDQGIVPAVRNQGSCGGCWAFGTVGIMEMAIKKVGGPLTDLSEQFLIDCNKDGWDCNGGLTATKYHYNVLGLNQTVAGAVLEADKPYLMANGTCTVSYSHPYKASAWQFIVPSEFTMPTVTEIKNAIYTYGPVTAGVCADSGWNTYSGGIYNPSSNACGGGTNHQIDIVGWDDGTSTWIVRNQWGSTWGDAGYMHLRWDETGTKSRIGEGTSWVRYTPPSPGFDSQFNGTKTGWLPVKGAWGIYNAAYYRSTGVANKFASAKHIGTYGNFLYLARMKRTGDTDKANHIVIRGRPTVLSSYYEWKPSYLFQYANDGSFSVFEITSTGTTIAKKNWTYSAAIVKNGWNTLKVRAYGSSLKFYINNTLVWSGSDSTRLSGQVGVGFYRDLSVGTLLVDWAKLIPIIADENLFLDFELAAPGVEKSGGSVFMAP